LSNISTARNQHAPVEVLLEMVFSTLVSAKEYKQDEVKLSSVGREPLFRQDLSTEAEE
jgi:hypothetical protein